MTSPFGTKRGSFLYGLSRDLTATREKQVLGALVKVRYGQELDFDERQILLEYFYGKYHEILIGYVRSLCPRKLYHTDAEDLVQEAFTTAMESLANRGGKQLRVSLFTFLQLHVHRAIRKYTAIRVIVDFFGPRKKRHPTPVIVLPLGWDLRNFHEL